MPPSLHSRPLAYGWALGLPLAIILALLVIEPTRLDFALADLFYQPGTGFIGAHSFFLEDVMHDRAKQAVIAVALLALIGFAGSCLYRPWHGYRRRLGYLVLAMGLSTAIVTPLKALTAVHCPWDLTRYGGSETYTPLLAERAPTAKPGRCWPGGHASSGFTFFALYFLLRDRNRRLARLALVGALALGGLFSIGRMMQGAHFLSHNLWTALLDWLICLGCYRFMLYAPQVDEAPQTATELAP
ncbi:phosphatase PAP2 family protein [Pseudomonas solani]|uniref:phosphatase PAP2 family protein n=1 Tax=Pseudomonas solani TaxID=2731552 RepID=UPI0035BE48DA